MSRGQANMISQTFKTLQKCQKRLQPKVMLVQIFK